VLPDLPNFRDVGGLASGELRPGSVFRSSELTSPDTAVHDALVSLRVSQVFDLRTLPETHAQPDVLPASVAITSLDVMADVAEDGASAIAAVFAHAVDRSDVAALSTGLGGGQGHRLMVEAYAELVALPSAHRAYRSLLLGIAENPGANVLHCTAGKDRTGWGAAVIQMLAGADSDHVAEHYLESNEAWADSFTTIIGEFEQAGGDPQALGDILWVRPAYLQSAFDAVESIYGSFHGYASKGLALQPDQVRQLQLRLMD
jgi:protein-tyrosine phosphatase